MAVTRSTRTGRLAAIAAVDRIKILLELVDGDDFLHEILSTANRMVEGSIVERSPSQSYPAGNAPQPVGASAVSVLEKHHHDAKKKSTAGLDIARIRLI